MRKSSLAFLALTLLTLLTLVPTITFAQAHVAAAGPGVGNIPQGTQSNSAYANSYTAKNVTNVDSTTQKTSCYTPEVPYAANDGPNDGYSGESPCNGAANTGENLGPYPTQAGSNPGYPAKTPMLVKDHSESDIRVDPTNPKHLIGSSKWVVSAEGYNHLLGFYESFDGGHTWSTQGHIPGYEGWTDNTDPVGAFDSFGNYYELILPYQFFYNADGTHNIQINPTREPNPAHPAEVISVAVRKHGATAASDWLTTHNGHPDYVATYDSVGREPDKQWITIDTNPASRFYNRIYAMWVVFTGPLTAHPLVSYAQALPNGTHTDWSAPIQLPEVSASPTGASYLLPHVTPDGTVYTTLTTTKPVMKFSFDKIALDRSTDGGVTWTTVSTVADNIAAPPSRYANTTFRDGILNSFGVGNHLVGSHYPLYVTWEDYSTGVTNILLAASYDGGKSWTPPIQVNDNQTPVDEFQPNLTVTTEGTVSVAFYDRRLSCPSAGSTEAVGAGLALDQVNPNYSGSLPPYAATNYCINASVQFYSATLAPVGHNIRLTQHTWDPQLNAPHTSCATCITTFVGDYFGNTTSGSINISSFVSTYNDGSNPANRQQQVVATVAIP
ncbi:MAG TPA: sialidase family protein [Ktedonobacteraceae bacterium]